MAAHPLCSDIDVRVGTIRLEYKVPKSLFSHRAAGIVLAFHVKVAGLGHGKTIYDDDMGSSGNLYNMQQCLQLCSEIDCTMKPRAHGVLWADCVAKWTRHPARASSRLMPN